MNLSSEQDKLLAARVADALHSAQNRHQTKYIGFLGEHEAAAAADMVRSRRHTAYRLFGGYKGAARVFLGVYSQYDEQLDQDFPISPITVLFRKTDTLTHRDFLGALLALGLSRDSVGDILISEGAAVVFATQPCAQLAASELTKVGSVGVQVLSGITVPIEAKREFEAIEGSVASLRLDCMVALVTRLSRERSSALITSGMVGINGRQIDNISYKLSAGDSFSVRGYGKFLFSEVNAVTRKGKQRVTVQKYK